MASASASSAARTAVTWSAPALAFSPDTFDVGIDIFGVMNWVRTLTNIPPWWASFKESLYDEMGDPATDGERHRAISPLFHAKNIRAPLLVVQGANDPARAEGRERRDRRGRARERRRCGVQSVSGRGHGFTKRANKIDASNTFVVFLGQISEGRRRMKTLLAAGLLLFFAQAHAACDVTTWQAPREKECCAAWMDENLHINDLLSIGTHNSYKSAIPDAEMAQLRTRSSKAAIVLDYSHRPLNEELDDGARQLELDVYYDPQGGRFADPAVRARSASTWTLRWLQSFAKPGFKVMHIPDFDFRSTCVRFVLVSAYDQGVERCASRSHSDLILINAKDDNPLGSGGAAVLKFDAAAFDALDAEIASVFSDKQLITPDQVQGKYKTLREAVRAGGWPKLGEARGRIFFALDEAPAKVAIYRGERRSLEGRRMFVNTDEDSPAAGRT
jgi:hypothetical protein